MSKIKIKDLPPEEREKLLAEMSAIAHNSTLSVKDKAKQLDAYSRKYSTSHQPESYFGILYEHGKDWQKAIKHLEQAEKLLTDDLLTAQIARHLAPDDGALNKVVNQLKIERAAIYCNIGFCYTSLGNKEQAFSYYNQALADNPNHAISLSNRANAHRQLGNYKAALIDARDAIRLQPDNAYAWYSLNRIHLNLGNYSQATYAARKAKELAPTNQELLALVAQSEKDLAAAQKGSGKQESRLLSSSSSSSSSSAPSQSDQIDIPSFKDSIAIRAQIRGSCRTIYNRTDIDFTKKAPALNNLSPAHSKSYAQHFYLGALSARENELQKAFYHYNQAEKLLIDELLIAQTARDAEPQDQVLAKEVNRLKTDRAVLYYNIGTYYEKLGNKEQAFSYLNQALADNPNYAIALSHRANAHGQLGNYKAALSDAYQAIYHQPGLASAWFRCSVAHAQLDEFSKARHALSKFKELVLVSTDKEWLEEATKLEKFIAAAQARSKEQERPAQQQPPSSSSSSSSSSQQQAAPKSSSLARSDGDAIMTAFKEGEVSKQPFGTLTKAIQVKQEKQESEQAPSSSSPTSPIQQLIDKRNPEKELPAPSPSATTKPFAARVSNKRNRDEQSSANATEQAQDTLQEPGKQSKSAQVALSRQTSSNGKGRK
jgi:tetratricopeptide (TPR) repeat protein